MNKFDEKYEIRLANFNEIDLVMKFIDEHWKKGHILGNNRDFFQYEMVIDGQVNFLVAMDKNSGLIDGLLGFLPCSKSIDKLDIWGVIWKTTDVAIPMLGMELKKRLMSLLNARTDLGVGANLGTSVPLLRRIYHYYTAKMKHYYCLANLEKFKIASIKNHVKFEKKCDFNTSYIEIKDEKELVDFFDFSIVANSIPYKDSWYYNHRFFKHPIYKYKVWGLQFNNEQAICVTKRQECNGSSAIRIVDYIGMQSIFSGCYHFLNDFLAENEYVDFYFDGFNEEYAVDAGMVSIEQYNDNVIPDYFYPYEQKNIDIYVDSSNNTDRCTFFKADGDQDRPN